MPVTRYMQNPLGTAADFVASSSTPRQELVQNSLTTSMSMNTTSAWLTLPAITTTESSTFRPIQTFITSLLYREPSDPPSTLATPTPASEIGEPSTNLDSNFPEFGKLAVTPYQLMYIVAVCVCFVIFMSFCCCTDDIARYRKSNRRNKNVATVQAYPRAMRFMDGATDTRAINRNSRSHSTVPHFMTRPDKRSDSPNPSTIPRNPFTKITIKTCEEGHDSIIIDEIELQDLSSEPSRDYLSSNNPDFSHEYVTTNPQAHIRNGKVSLRGGSSTQGSLSDNFLRTGAITSFRQTEERWRPTWSATKSLFGTRRRQSEPAPIVPIEHPISGAAIPAHRNYPAVHYHDHCNPKSSTTTSKRAPRQNNTSGTEFSFPLSDGSDSEIPRFLTINRIKQKLKPLIHSVSRQSLRERFSSVDHGRDHNIQVADLDELVHSSTVKRALGIARSSGSIPVDLFKLPGPAIDDPEPSVAGGVSLMANDSSSDCSNALSENTMRARSPVSTILGISVNRRSVSKSGSGDKKGSRRGVMPSSSYKAVVNEVDLGAVRTFHDLPSHDREGGRELLSVKTVLASEKDEKDEDESLLRISRDDETKDESYVTCRSTISSQKEDNDEVDGPEQEQSDAPPPSYMKSTRSGHVRRDRNTGPQTAMSNHFHARGTRTKMNSSDSSETLVANTKERMKGRLGLLMIRGVAGADGDGDGGGIGANKRREKVEWLTMNLGGDD
ncbi:hypothetical protein NHQ30_005752 [Ciborinia camelliae]|nr:hypothetical protein NHQ30_005752 [Ciborinia camelliae]